MFIGLSLSLDCGVTSLLLLLLLLDCGIATKLTIVIWLTLPGQPPLLIGVEKAEDRLMVLHFAGAIQASIVVAYAPTEVSDAPSKDYSALDATLDALPRHRMIMILGT